MHAGWQTCRCTISGRSLPRLAYLKTATNQPDVGRLRRWSRLPGRYPLRQRIERVTRPGFRVCASGRSNVNRKKMLVVTGGTCRFRFCTNIRYDVNRRKMVACTRFRSCSAVAILQYLDRMTVVRIPMKSGDTVRWVVREELFQKDLIVGVLARQKVSVWIKWLDGLKVWRHCSTCHRVVRNWNTLITVRHCVTNVISDKNVIT